MSKTGIRLRIFLVDFFLFIDVICLVDVMLDIIIASYGLSNHYSEFVPLNLHHGALNLTTMAFIKIID